MTPAETTTILRQFNEWRRGADVPQPKPREIGEAIDAAIAMIDRLEAAESDALEQARLSGMGASREASLMAKLEAAEKSDAESIAMYRKARDERDELRAKIEAMERQEPVGRALLCVRCSTPFDGEHYCPACGHHTATEEAVYALPGAQPAPSIPSTELRPVIEWLRNGCDPLKAADELEMLAAPEAKP